MKSYTPAIVPSLTTPFIEKEDSIDREVLHKLLTTIFDAFNLGKGDLFSSAKKFIYETSLHLLASRVFPCDSLLFAVTIV